MLPLRRAWGFEVLGAWVIEQESKFVWILHYGGPKRFEARDATYARRTTGRTCDPTQLR